MRPPKPPHLSLPAPKPFPPGSALRLQRLLKTAATVAEQRRIQAVLIRALDASPPERIAQVTGLSVNSWTNFWYRH